MSLPLDLEAVYKQMNKSADHGIVGYHVAKVYIDPLQQIKQRSYAHLKKGEKSRRYQTKRGNFLDDESSVHKHCPGPGTYKNEAKWSQKQKVKRVYSKKLTYIDEIIKHQKQNKFPAPGSYNIVKTIKQLEKEKKMMAMKKPEQRDKLTYLDEVQYQSSLVPGAGNYNPRVRSKTETSNSKVQRKPQQWRKIHAQKVKKKPQKTPDMRTYNPRPSFQLFDSITSKKHNKNFLGKTDRFKISPSSVPPPHKYQVLQKWRGKTTNKLKLQRHGLQSISKGLVKSVYYH